MEAIQWGYYYLFSTSSCRRQILVPLGSQHSSAVGKSALSSRNSRIHTLLHTFSLSFHLLPCMEISLQVSPLGKIVRTLSVTFVIVIDPVSSVFRTGPGTRRELQKALP